MKSLSFVLIGGSIKDLPAILRGKESLRSFGPKSRIEILLADRDLPVLRGHDSSIETRKPAADSYVIYRFLKKRRFDVVYFFDNRGLAYYALLAKKLGLGLERTLFGVKDRVKVTQRLRDRSRSPSARDAYLRRYLVSSSRLHADFLFSDLSAYPGQKAPGSKRFAVRSISPLVSVCIAHRNRPALLRQCLKSLARQTYRNFEVIVVDDGSNPKYRQRLEASFTDLSLGKCRILFLGARKGPCVARNTAAALADGKFLLFMDDDNVARPHEIAQLVRIAGVERADIVTCAYDRFAGYAPPNDRTRPISTWVPIGDDLATGVVSNTFGDMNCLIKRKAFQQIGGLIHAREPYGEDAELLARALFAGFKLVAVPDPLFWYRVHRGNMSKKTAQNRTSRLLPLLPYVENGWKV